MRGRFHFYDGFFPNGVTECILAFCFPLGIFSGMVCFWSGEPALTPFFVGILNSCPRFSEYLLALFLPFLLSGIFLSMGFWAFLPVICIGKAFLFGFFCSGLCISLNLPAVVCFQVCLASSLPLAFLYGFCRRHIASKAVPSPLEMLSCFAGILVFGFLFFAFSTSSHCVFDFIERI